MKRSRSLVGVSLMNRVRNEEVRRRAGIERELAMLPGGHMMLVIAQLYVPRQYQSFY